jgi:hypothetical protein
MDSRHKQVHRVASRSLSKRYADSIYKGGIVFSEQQFRQPSKQTTAETHTPHFPATYSNRKDPIYDENKTAQSTANIKESFVTERSRRQTRCLKEQHCHS